MSPSGARGGGRGETSRLDESDVRVRPGRGTRPRSKRRPEHADAVGAMVVGVDRGRWTCAPDEDPSLRVVAMRAREMGRTPVVVGDRVGIVGDVSGGEDALARIVRVDDRTSVLRRTADDTDPYERVVVANASHLVIVTAVADPVPRTGFVDRALVAAYAGGLEPVLCLTKSDLADPAEFAANYADLDLPGRRHPRRPRSDGAARGRRGARVGVHRALRGRQVDAGQRARAGRLPRRRRRLRRREGTPHVDVGRGPRPARPQWLGRRHPGHPLVRARPHRSDDVVAAFGDLAAAIEECPRGCAHLGPPSDPECALDTEVAAGRLGAGRLDALRRVLTALRTPAWETGG